MSTIVFLHAHPDDESSSTAGSMARLVDGGHRVVLVVATDGGSGVEAVDSLHDTVAEHRRHELEAAAAIIGVHRIVQLGYADSGMTGWAQNDAPGSFMRVDPRAAARRVADVLDEEDADVLVGYDWHGNYGHPDHVMVHHVARAAVEVAARRPRLLQVTANRDAMRRAVAELAAAGQTVEFGDPDQGMDDGNPFGSSEDEITWRVDVSAWLGRKRRALQCHASQTSDVTQLLALPAPMFRVMFAHEHFIEDGVDQPMTEAWPF